MYDRVLNGSFVGNAKLKNAALIGEDRGSMYNVGHVF